MSNVQGQGNYQLWICPSFAWKGLKIFNTQNQSCCDVFYVCERYAGHVTVCWN